MAVAFSPHIIDSFSNRTRRAPPNRHSVPEPVNARAMLSGQLKVGPTPQAIDFTGP